MIPFLQGYLLIFLAVISFAVVLTRDPVRQVISLSFYGITLGVFFFLCQAPDVALSQIVIGAAVLPLMVMLTVAKIKSDRERKAGS